MINDDEWRFSEMEGLRFGEGRDYRSYNDIVVMDEIKTRKAAIKSIDGEIGGLD